MNAARRRPASPYARRLARERGLMLERVAGTGPDGRIVAADIETFARRPAEAAPSATAVSAFAATLDLGPLHALLASLGRAGTAVPLDAMLLRAAALALEAVPAARGPDAATAIVVGLEPGSGACAIVADAHLGLVSALRDRLAAAREAPPSDAAPALTLRRLARRGIRPAAMPLRPGVRLRLVVSAEDGAAAAEALLSFDAALVAEGDAAALLARFRDSLETPLLLLA